MIPFVFHRTVLDQALDVPGETAPELKSAPCENDALSSTNLRSLKGIHFQAARTQDKTDQKTI